MAPIRFPALHVTLPRRKTLAFLLIAFSFFAALAITTSAAPNLQVWAAAHDLRAGAVIASNDVKLVKVSLPENIHSYFGDQTRLVGKSLTRDVSSQELIPALALGSVPHPNTQRIFPLHVLRNDLPFDVKIGDRIDLYAIPNQNISIAQNNVGGITSPTLIGTAIPIAGIDQKSKDLGGDIGLTLALNQEDVFPLVIDISNTRVLVVRHAL